MYPISMRLPDAISLIRVLLIQKREQNQREKNNAYSSLILYMCTIQTISKYTRYDSVEGAPGLVRHALHIYFVMCANKDRTIYHIATANSKRTALAMKTTKKWNLKTQKQKSACLWNNSCTILAFIFRRCCCGSFNMCICSCLSMSSASFEYSPNKWRHKNLSPFSASTSLYLSGIALFQVCSL